MSAYTQNLIHAVALVEFTPPATFALRGTGFTGAALTAPTTCRLTLQDAIGDSEAIVLLSPRSAAAPLAPPRYVKVDPSTIDVVADDGTGVMASFSIAVLRVPGDA